MDKIRVGVIGVGYLGSIHAKIYRNISACQLTGICDTDGSRAKEISSSLDVPGFTDYRQLLDKVDAVSIAVPTMLHHEIAAEALKRKIHVLVEKPFTSTLKQAGHLIDLARKNKAILQVGHIERFNSAFTATRKIINNPVFIECHRLSTFPKRSLDVGVVLDIMIHDIDIILGLIRSRIKRIEAVGINVLTPYEDIANARIVFANRCVCNLTASRISDETMRKIRIFQENTYISLDYFNAQASVYRKQADKIVKEDLPIEKEQPLDKEIFSFLDCVAAKKEPLVSGVAAREALKVALAIQDQIWKK